MSNSNLFLEETKYNTSINLTEADKKNKVKIYCQESYAQSLYDAITAHENKMNISVSDKDLKPNNIYKVVAKTISFGEKILYVEEINSKIMISVPFKEYSKSLDSLQDGSDSSKFYVMITRVTPNGEFIASEKKASALTYREELFSHLNDNTWFDVKITKLVKGGYLASYKDQVECFIPGSHAAANVVTNFSEMLNKVLPVMVDNYDTLNNLFILSYKKYITHSMPTMISELKFDHEYIGTLTNKPYDFGVFVEIDGYYTGLVHSSEFEDYNTVRKTLKSGDKIKVYIKDVTSKAGQYRIVLTLKQDQVNSEKLEWQALRNKVENNKFSYSVNNNKNSITIDIDSEQFEVSINRNELEKNLSSFPMVKISKVDPINKQLKFEFVK